MNKTVSVLARAKVSAGKSTEASAPSRAVVANVGVAALSSPVKDAQEKTVQYSIRHLPVSEKELFKKLKKAGVYRGSFNLYVLEALREKLTKDEKKMAKLAAKG